MIVCASQEKINNEKLCKQPNLLEIVKECNQKILKEKEHIYGFDFTKSDSKLNEQSKLLLEPKLIYENEKSKSTLVEKMKGKEKKLLNINNDLKLKIKKHFMKLKMYFES